MIPTEAFPLPAGMVDRREHAAQRHFFTAKYPDGVPVRDRDWRHTTGVCLHQTACLMGGRIDRWDHTGAHLGVLRDGTWRWLHDFNKVVVAANGWDAQCVSIEVDGIYAGVEGDPHTVWDDPSTKIHEAGMDLTEPAAETTRNLIRFIYSEVARNGGEIKALVAHRQSSLDRQDDPGSGIWKRCALPLHAELGLTDGGVGFVLGGYPIPEAWDPRCVGIKY